MGTKMITRTSLITHASDSARHILEAALPLANRGLHVADVPDLEQPTSHGYN